MKTHTITAEWLSAKLENSGEPRMIIKGKYLYCWGKDEWGDEKPKKYKFLGKCPNLYAFIIKCRGKDCSWSH